MRNWKFILSAIALVVLGMTGGQLLAQQAGRSATQPQKEIVKLMGEHQMTLAKAIELAEQQTKGRAIDATTSMAGTTDAQVNATCIVGDSVRRVTVDVDTGKVTESSQQTSAPRSHRQMKREHNRKKP